MSQPCRWVSRLARLAMAVGTVVSFGVGQLAAQGTAGKIEGTIRDPSGAPIAGAQVLIVGSAFAGVSNEQGYYFLNNVPAGVMTVRAQYIGYSPSEARNVRVFAGQTMTVNMTLEQRAVTVEGITVVAQANPIVPRDQVTSKPIVQGDLIENLPVDNIQQVLRLQPGVVESARGLSVRGGRVGEAAVYIDGVLVRSVSGSTGAPDGGTGLVGANALEEVSVTTGAIGAELGDAQSGVISLVTRSGGSRFRGSLSYATDEVSGETYGTGDHRVEASIGGPLARNLTFFLAATLQGQQSPRLGLGSENTPIYALNGVDTTVTVAVTPGSATTDSITVALPAFTRYSSGIRRPDDWSDNMTIDAKLQYSFGSGSRISATLHRQRNQNLAFRGGGLYNPMSQRGNRSNSNALILNWSQNLASGEHALFLDVKFSAQRDESVAGLLDQAWFNDHHDPRGWFSPSSMQFVTNLDNFPINDRLVRNIRVNNCLPGTSPENSCIPYINRNDFNTSAPYRTNPYGVAGYASTGIGTGGPNLAEETRYTGSANLDWQANRYNRVRVGGDFVSSTAGTFTSGLTNQSFMDAVVYSPIRYGLYATDRLDLGDIVIDLGLRYDRLDSGIEYPNTPGRIFTDPLRDGDLSKANTAADTAIANRCAANLAAADTTAWSTCNFFTAAPRSVLAPSLRISFPVTDRTGFRLSYSHQVQTPSFNLLATGVNADLAFTNTNDIFGRDLDFGKSIAFEFGIRHAFSDDMVLDIAAYNKDKVSDITGRILPVFDGFSQRPINVNLLTNADFGNVRGVDIKLDRRIGSMFQGTIAYTYQSARSTGSDPFEYLNTLSRNISSVTGERVSPPQALLTTRDNRTHTIAGNLALNLPHGWHSGTAVGTLLQDVGVFATFRFASGLAYTRMVNAGTGATAPGNNFGLSGQPIEPLNASTMPWIKNVDLRVTRALQLGRRDLTVFADFRNLFNWTNLTSLYAETGDIVNEQRRQQLVNPGLQVLQAEAGNMVETRTVVVGGVSRQTSGINLSDCSQYFSNDEAGVPNCIMLQRAEVRFGNGDKFYTMDEQTAAFNANYNLFNGPSTFRGPGFNMRLGFELNF